MSARSGRTPAQALAADLETARRVLRQAFTRAQGALAVFRPEIERLGRGVAQLASDVDPHTPPSERNGGPRT